MNIFGYFLIVSMCVLGAFSITCHNFMNYDPKERIPTECKKPSPNACGITACETSNGDKDLTASCFNTVTSSEYNFRGCRRFPRGGECGVCICDDKDNCNNPALEKKAWESARSPEVAVEDPDGFGRGSGDQGVHRHDVILIWICLVVKQWIFD